MYKAWYRIHPDEKAALVATLKSSAEARAGVAKRLAELQNINKDGIRCVVSKEQADYLTGVLSDVDAA